MKEFIFDVIFRAIIALIYIVVAPIGFIILSIVLYFGIIGLFIVKPGEYVKFCDQLKRGFFDVGL